MPTIKKSAIFPIMLKGILARIDARLKVVGLSESKAAKMAGLSDSAIRDIRRAVNGGREDGGVNTRTLAALSPILKTTPEYLFTGRGPDEAIPEALDDVARMIAQLPEGFADDLYDEVRDFAATRVDRKRREIDRSQ